MHQNMGHANSLNVKQSFGKISLKSLWRAGCLIYNFLLIFCFDVLKSDFIKLLVIVMMKRGFLLIKFAILDRVRCRIYEF